MISGPKRERISRAARMLIVVGAVVTVSCAVGAFITRGTGYDYSAAQPAFTGVWASLFIAGMCALAAVFVGIVLLLLTWEDEPRARRTVAFVVLALALAVASAWLIVWSFFNPPPRSAAG